MDILVMGLIFGFIGILVYELKRQNDRINHLVKHMANIYANLQVLANSQKDKHA